MGKGKKSKKSSNYSNVVKERNKKLRIARDTKFKTEVVPKKRERIIKKLKLLGFRVEETQTLQKLRNILNKKRKLITAKVI